MEGPYWWDCNHISQCIECAPSDIFPALSITVVPPNTAVLVTGGKPAVFCNSGIGREDNLNKNMRQFGVAHEI